MATNAEYHETVIDAYGNAVAGASISVTNADGTVSQVSLFDAFLNPTNAEGAFTQSLATLARFGYEPQPGYLQYGAGAVLDGIAGQARRTIAGVMSLIGDAASANPTDRPRMPNKVTSFLNIFFSI